MFARISNIALVGFLFVALGGVFQAATAQTEENKVLERRAWEEVWNQGNLAAIDEIFAADYVGHNPGMPPLSGTEGYRQFFTIYSTAFPDMHYTIEDMIAEGDKVATRWTMTGTHEGELMGIPSTGVWITMTGISMSRFADGKLAEGWNSYDGLGMMQQFGVIPPMGRVDFTWGVPSAVTGAPGDPEANKAIVRREIEEVWGQGNLATLDEIYATDFVNHDPSRPDVTDLESYKGWAAMCLTDYPDLYMPIEDIIAEGDKVAYRWTFTGTHKDLGKQVSDPGMTICRFADGKIVEAWLTDDMLGALTQLGVIPGPAAVERSTWGQVKSLFK
jgi:steroid delta-isomerase-like uncharacterized protein